MKTEIYKNCGHKATRKPWRETTRYFICEECNKENKILFLHFLKSEDDIITIVTDTEDKEQHNLAVKYYLKGYNKGRY